MARAMLVPRRDRSWLASGLKGVKGWEEGVELSGLGYLALVPLLACPHGRCCCATISSHYYYLLVYYRNTRYFYNYLLLAYCPLRPNIPVHTQDRNVSH